MEGVIKLVLLLCSLQLVCCTLGIDDYKAKTRPDILKFRNKCYTASGVTEKMIDNVRRGVFGKANRMKEYLACLWLVSDVMDIHFNINSKIFDKYVPPQFTEKTLEKYEHCYTMTKSLGNKLTFVDKIWVMTQCNYFADPKNFVIY